MAYAAKSRITALCFRPNSLIRFFLIWAGLSLSPIAEQAQAVTVFVRPSAASSENSFNSLPEALKAIPRIRSETAYAASITIELAPGVHRVTEPILLTEATSGTPTSPLIIRGAHDGSTILLGSALLASRPAQPSDASEVHLPKEVRLASLSEEGVKFFRTRRSTFAKTKTSGLEVFQAGRRLAYTRWPLEGFSEDIQVLPTGRTVSVRFPPELTKRLSSEKAAWVSGYWSRDWAFESAPLASFDSSERVFKVDSLQTPFPPRHRFRYALENLLSEMKSPGQFVLYPDGQLFYIPYPGDDSQIEVAVSNHIFVVQGAHDVRIERLQVSQTLAEAIQIVGSSDITVEDCAITGTGTWGIEVTNSSRVLIDKCVISEIAEGGILLDGGNRITLTSGNNAVKNSVVSDFGIENPAYRPGIQLQGVGNSIVGSLIVHGPHSGILVSGNDNTIMNNELADLVRDTNDAGAIYMGRDWTMRGNRISENFIHDIEFGSKKTAVGVYLDDQFSGTTITRNIFYRVNLPILVGGGRDNEVSTNLFMAPTKPAILIDDRGQSWQRSMTETELEKRLQAMPTTSSAWKARYPSLALLKSDEKGAPGGNEITFNVVTGNALYRYLGSSIDKFIHLTGNKTIDFPSKINDYPSADRLADFLETHPELDLTHLRSSLVERRLTLSNLRYAPLARSAFYTIH
ncbi:right-handed parallel beta-helix repeat-containing protein [Bradyrhizobium sp. 151]|uniref:right-handed parallel beta-helix repeat-containing protein n=1 Tax=Bradyrhizobium sp. 151 TaxID=2782626 RepID=UPI001FFA7437|nr:right-handed parallel beta-helix repeat-containing protein [Bradyrhizobium sp. 151]